MVSCLEFFTMKKLTIIRANKTKFGGAERYLQRLSDELSRIGVSHGIINSPFPKWLPSWVRAILFNIYACIKKKNIYFSLERVTCSDIYRAGDGVHKVFIQLEHKTFLNPLHFIYIYIEKHIFTNAKKIIAISDMVKKDIVKTYNIDPGKIDIVYNGIEDIKFNYHKSFIKINKEFPIKNKKIILFVGSGYERKGVQEFLKIVSNIDLDFMAFIIGKDKNIDFYKNLAIELGVNDKVIFTGPRSDVYDFFTIGDIFLFPTRYEPFGNVILEAMRLKNAIFTTNRCGGGELIDKTFIFNINTQPSLVSSKIEKLLNNAKELEAIKEKNYQISKSFTIEKNAKLTMEIINEYLH